MFQDGFLGYRASFMLDFVVVALVLVVPLVAWSIYEVKRGHFIRHRNLQILLTAVLTVTVALFEIDLQWVQGGWRNLIAKQTPALSDAALAEVTTALRLHLVFAISTPALWLITLAAALRKYPSPPRPGTHSRWHKKLGWVSTVDLVLTSVTGLLFYYLAFIR